MGPAFAAIAPVHSGDDENRTGLWLTMVEAVHEKSGKGADMPENDNTTDRRQFTANIVAAYVGRNQITATQLPSLISTVHQTLDGLGKLAMEAVVERTPAVQIRRSITANSVICMDHGYRGRMLKRHLTRAHGLSVE